MSQSVDGLNAVVIPERKLLVVASTQSPRQIDLYDIRTGELVRHCRYEELDPGLMCTGDKNQILVVDRSTDPWRIAVLDTRHPNLPIIRHINPGVRFIWGVCFAETPSKKLIYVSSYRLRCIRALDAKNGAILQHISTPTWGPFTLTKSNLGCLFVTNIQKQCREIYVYDYNLNYVTTLRHVDIKGVFDVHCLSQKDTMDNDNEKESYLVLGHLQKSKRCVSVFQLSISKGSYSCN